VVLRCPAGHEYAVVEGIPILLRDDIEHMHWVAEHALAAARGAVLDDPPAVPGHIDPYVQQAIAATGGFMYAGAAGSAHGLPGP
jgi:hypothetical protein